MDTAEFPIKILTGVSMEIYLIEQYSDMESKPKEC